MALAFTVNSSSIKLLDLCLRSPAHSLHFHWRSSPSVLKFQWFIPFPFPFPRFTGFSPPLYVFSIREDKLVNHNIFQPFLNLPFQNLSIYQHNLLAYKLVIQFDICWWVKFIFQLTQLMEFCLIFTNISTNQSASRKSATIHNPQSTYLCTMSPMFPTELVKT
jgi:hypothetical protein